MTRTRLRAARVLGPALVASLAFLAACEERVENPTPPAQANQQPKSETVVEGGGAGLGKAKQSATAIEQKADEYNRQLEKQIDEINK